MLLVYNGKSVSGVQHSASVYCCCLDTKPYPALLRPHRLQSTRLLCPWDFPGKNTRVGCHFLLQGIFPTQGLNLYLLLCRQILYYWATMEAHDSVYIYMYKIHIKYESFLSFPLQVIVEYNSLCYIVGLCFSYFIWTITFNSQLLARIYHSNAEAFIYYH